MSSNSALTLEVLVALVIVGIVAVIFVPQMAPTIITMIVTALIGIIQNLTGVKAGGKLPEQVGDAKPGQSSQSETTSKISTQAQQEPAEPTK